MDQRLKKSLSKVAEFYDLFYTYLVMHEEFAEMLAERAKRGSIFMVYGLNRILPRYPGVSPATESEPHGRDFSALSEGVSPFVTWQ